MPILRSRWIHSPDRLTAEDRDRLMVLYLHLQEGVFSQDEYDEMARLERAATTDTRT